MSKHIALFLVGTLFAGCASAPRLPALPTASKVDLPRFMGDWYVIANIPTLIEKGAYNAVESYQRDADGSIATTFTFNKDGFDGPRKTYQPRGFVVDRASNAREYVWIMARTPTLSTVDYCRLHRQVADAGYDLTKLRQVPQGSAREPIACPQD